MILLFLNVHNPKTKIWEGMKAIDWFGTVTMLGVTLMTLLGLDFGGETFPWNSPKVICLIVFGILMLGLFIFSEAKLAKYPLIPLRLFRNGSNVAALVVSFVHGFVSTIGRRQGILETDCPFTGLYIRRVLLATLLPVRARSLTFALRHTDFACDCHRGDDGYSHRRADPSNRSLS